MSKIKGGQEVACQNFSMHPDLMKAIMDVAAKLNLERAEVITQDRSKRITYSKVVASLVYHMQDTMMHPENTPSDKLRQLIKRYENSTFEDPDVPPKSNKDVRGKKSNAKT